MNIAAVLKTLESSGLAAWLRGDLYAFPIVESFHVVGLTMVFGTIAIIDLRLLGLAWINRPFSIVKLDVMKWTWAAFALTILTGFLMFITNAAVYFQNFQFRSKMAAIALSGINMLIFEFTTGRSVARWDTNRSAPPAGRVAGALSLILWITVIFFGRWIGFTTTGNVTPPNEIDLNDLFH